MQQQTSSETFDPVGMVADLNSLLRLKTTVIGLKIPTDSAAERS